MKFLFAILLAFALVHPADASVRCGQYERFGTRMVLVGDLDRRVIEAKPDRTVRLETAEGGAAGWRFDFYRRGQVVQVYVRAGVVVRICRMRY